MILQTFLALLKQYPHRHLLHNNKMVVSLYHHYQKMSANQRLIQFLNEGKDWKKKATSILRCCYQYFEYHLSRIMLQLTYLTYLTDYHWLLSFQQVSLMAGHLGQLQKNKKKLAFCHVVHSLTTAMLEVSRKLS